MASQAFPPTPAQPSPQGGPPSPVGQAMSGAQPQIAQLIPQAAAGLKALAMLAKVLGQVKPEAAQKFTQGIAAIQEGIQLLKGGGTPGPTAPQGEVPPPPQMAAESPEPETPEAT